MLPLALADSPHTCDARGSALPRKGLTVDFVRMVEILAGYGSARTDTSVRLLAMTANRNRYLASFSEELRAQANRVRDLIGDKHWLSDGHHKEYLLKHALSRHVPSGVTISRGFIVHPKRSDVVSREQDLLFLDAFAMAPVFAQGELCVALPQQVIAILAVKTTFSKQQLDDACDTLHSARRVAAYAGIERPPWCGALFFEFGDSAPDCARVSSHLASFDANVEQLPNMVSLPDVVAILGAAGFVVDSAEERLPVRGFSGDGMVLLLHSLLAHVARYRNYTGAELESFFARFGGFDPIHDSPCHVGR